MKKYLIISSCIGILFFSSCKKSFFEVNTNPNQPTAVALDQVLAASLKVTADRFTSGLEFACMWNGHWATAAGYQPAADVFTYTFTNSYYQGVFNTSYSNLTNYDYIEQTATAGGQKFYLAIAKIMKVYVYHNLVDVYNDIPYSQALQINTFPTPKYDAGASIYADLFIQLDAAIAALKTTSDPQPASTADIVFGTSSDSKVQWIKLANTIKLKMLLRMSQMTTKPTYYAAQTATVAAESNGFLTTSALVNPGYNNTANNKQNPFYATYGYSITGAPTGSFNYYKAHKYAINFYNSTADNRLGKFYAPVSGTTYAGGDFGATPVNPTSDIGSGLLASSSQSAVLLSSFESYFIQSEAAFRGMLPGADYKALFKSGVTASYTYLGLSVPQATAYYSQTTNAAVIAKVNIDATTTPLATIINQKWASINVINPLEPYADYRRLKLPVDLPGSVAVGTPIPNRLYYPLSENQSNATNVPAATLTSKIFWQL